MAATLDRTVLAPNEGFIRFNCAARAAHRRETSGAHRFAKTMFNKPRRWISDIKQTMKLMGRNAFLAGCHQVNSQPPFAERHLGFLKNGSNRNRELALA